MSMHPFRAALTVLQPIPAIGRMSAFAPANIPICALLLWPTNNTAFIITAQIINQTYNVICNYSNRSASGEISNSLLAGGRSRRPLRSSHSAFAAYFGAVGSSVGIAYSLNKLSKSYQAKPDLSPAMRGFMRGFVPFVAVAMAGCVNVLMIRQKELTGGVAVFDEFVTRMPGRFDCSACCDGAWLTCVLGRARSAGTRRQPAAMHWPSAVWRACCGTSR